MQQHCSAKLLIYVTGDADIFLLAQIHSQHPLNRFLFTRYNYSLDMRDSSEFLRVLQCVNSSDSIVFLSILMSEVETGNVVVIRYTVFQCHIYRRLGNNTVQIVLRV
jgi:hypothetical protein